MKVYCTFSDYRTCTKKPPLMGLRLFIANLHMSEHLISIYLNYCENFYENTGLEIIHGKPTPAAHLSCSAAGLSTITSAASFSALLALCSPSAAITFARASRAASASINIFYYWLKYVLLKYYHNLQPSPSAETRAPSRPSLQPSPL